MLQLPPLSGTLQVYQFAFLLCNCEILSDKPHLSLVLARVWPNKQIGRDGDVLIVELITIINCMYMYVTQS